VNERDERHGRPADFAPDEPLPQSVAEPVDVVQVRADDALIAALSGQTTPRVDDPIDERLADLLRSWRDDVRHEEDHRPLVDLSAATAALASAPKPRRRPQSPFGPWATAAAILVIAFVGLGLAAKGAEPGDPLWNVTKMLYSDKAKSVEAAVTVRHKLDDADRALRNRDFTTAKIALDEAKRQLPVVAVEDGHQQLASRTEQLLAQINGPTSVTPTPSTTPQPATTPESTTTTTTTTTISPPAVPSESPTSPSSEPPSPTNPPTPTTPVSEVQPPGAGTSGAEAGTGVAETGVAVQPTN
jgi:Anti-sigma-D factor RsdA to sigma factor binding region